MAVFKSFKGSQVTGSTPQGIDDARRDWRIVYLRNYLRSVAIEANNLARKQSLRDHPFFPAGNVIIKLEDVDCQKLSITIVIAGSGDTHAFVKKVVCGQRPNRLLKRRRK